MDENELKTTIGEAAFGAMSAEQRTALMGKFTKPATKEGGGAGGNAEVLAAIKAMQTEIAALKAPKAPEEDPTLAAIQKNKQAQTQQKATQDRIVQATKFNVGLETFLKQYEGVLPADAYEIPKVATAAQHPDEIERSNALKSSLIESFFKEEANQKLLTDSQLAKLKAWRQLGLTGRHEGAEAIYETVFEPAVNQARATRQAQLLAKQDLIPTGSKDSDIVFNKVHTKLMRSLVGTHKLNDVLYEQAKRLGLVNQQS